jgi:hypothetical protein
VQILKRPPNLSGSRRNNYIKANYQPLIYTSFYSQRRA